MLEFDVILHDQIDDRSVRSLIRKKGIVLAGHRKSLIYGRLDCYQGKRMKRANRVFFATEAHAQWSGFRPCGQCLRAQFALWQARKA